MEKKIPKFVRKDAGKKPRFSSRRKTKWRRQKGIDSKIRQKMKSYSRMPNIGFGSPKASRNLIQGKKPILIHKFQDLQNIKPNQIALVAHTSTRNQIEIAKKAKEKGIKIQNMNIKKVLRLEKIKKKPETKIETVKSKENQKNKSEAQTQNKI